MISICLVPRLHGAGITAVGGMVSFQHRLAKGLEARSMRVSYDPDDLDISSILVVGGTRQLAKLWRARRRGVRLVQRLDGMNWLHKVADGGSTGGSHKPLRRRPKQGKDLRHYIRAEYSNWLMLLIRNRLAHAVIYQSEFARNWWQREYGDAGVEHTVIHNGVDLDEFTPNGDGSPPDEFWRLLLVEGSLMGGYEMGLESAVELAVKLADCLQQDAHKSLRRPVELCVAGKVSPEVKKEWQGRLSALGSSVERQTFRLNWAGLVPGERVPQLDRTAHLLFSADLNAACPNSVIEALACGLPVVAFNTGALNELVRGDAGRIVAYGGDPWKLDPPDTDTLAAASLEVLQNLDHHRKAARQCAVDGFNIDRVVDDYLRVLIDG